MNEDEVKLAIFNNIKAKHGIKLANDVYDNWNYYKPIAEKMQDEIALLDIYKQMIENNKKSLTNIAINGEYFNGKQSSFYSNKKSFLVFEDEKSHKTFETKIAYDDFKIFVENNLDDMAVVFVYLNTFDLELMRKVCDIYQIDELMEI